MEPRQIFQKFAIEGEATEIKPLGNGLINDTFKVITAGNSPDYVLQKVNHHVFTDVDMLQSNILAVTSHIRAKKVAEGETDIDRKVLRFIPLKGSEKTYFYDGETDTYWRVMVFINDAITLEEVTEKTAEEAGEAFGNFQSMLSDIDKELGETIKDFHNIEFRITQLKDAIKSDPVGRLKECQEIVDEILADEKDMCASEQLYRDGLLPKRICHCDTKVNNMMFDKNGQVLCVIDLDTVMPSFIFSDFGDFLRYAACTTPEDEPDLDKIDFRLDIYEAFTKGYLRGTKAFLTETEKSLLPYAAMLFPYMQAIRFLADYINGDTYYRIKYPEHNLVRTKAQLRLYEKVKAKQLAMTIINIKLANSL